MRDVDLHAVTLVVEPARAACLSDLLSPDERSRAARFRFDRDRSRYIVCRGTLRELLGAHLSLPPARIEFSYSRYGKPTTAGCFFNVSHSENMALVAISRGRVVGVDIERIDPAFARENIAERFFSPPEIRAMRALPEAGQLAAFFRIWTRKEAYIKARGEGMSHPLDSFDALAGVEGWEIESLEAAPGYAAAVAASNESAEPRVSAGGANLQPVKPLPTAE